MRTSLKSLLISAAFALVAGGGIATTAAPAKADLFLGLNLGTPFYYQPYYYRPYYYSPYYYSPYYYSGSCYWDAWYGRVCY